MPSYLFFVVLGRNLSGKTSPTCFNTSHVVVYLKKKWSVTISYEFQYISCCSLSIDVNALAYAFNSFNTSHVVVYLQ